MLAQSQLAAPLHRSGGSGKREHVPPRRERGRRHPGSWVHRVRHLAGCSKSPGVCLRAVLSFACRGGWQRSVPGRTTMSGRAIHDSSGSTLDCRPLGAESSLAENGHGRAVSPQHGGFEKKESKNNRVPQPCLRSPVISWQVEIGPEHDLGNCPYACWASFRACMSPASAFRHFQRSLRSCYTRDPFLRAVIAPHF